MSGWVRAALRSPHLAAVGVIVVVSLAFFFPLLTGDSFSAVPGYQDAVYPWAAHNNGETFYPQSDQAALNYPWQAELTLSLRDGTIPWWNPDSFGGQPLYADGSSALLYPPRLVLAELVSPRTAHNALSVFHVTLAGLFTYWLLVDLEVSPVAALLGAVAWMFGSFTLGWIQLEVVAPVFAWLPAGLVTMRRAVLRSWRWSVGAALAVAMLFVSSHLLFADISVVTVCLYGGFLALRSLVARRRSGARSALAPAARALVGAALGVGLAAFVLVPTAASLGGISRQTLSFSTISHGLLLSFSDLRYAWWPAPLPITATELNWNTAFAGTLTAGLALVGLLLRRKGSGLGRGLVIGAVLVAVGGPVGYLAYKVIPGMNVFRPYSRLLFLFDLGLAVLGAVGLDAVMRGIARSPHGAPAVAAPNAGEVGTGAAVGSQVPRTGRWWVSRIVGVVVVALTALQLGHYGREINPPFLPSSAALSFPATPLVRALQTPPAGVGGWANRVLPANDSVSGWQPPMLDSDDSLVFGIAAANGYDSSVPTRTVDVWRVVGGETPAAVSSTKLSSAFQPVFDAPLVRFDLLPRLGVDQMALTPPATAVPGLMDRVESLGWRPVYQGADGTVLDWAGPPTGPVVVFAAHHVPDDATALAQFASPGFDYRREVILDDAGSSPSPRRPPGRSSVLFARQGVNSATVKVRASRPGYLVVPDMWDPGWTAVVNGVATPVERGDFNEQVVAVPGGTSLVVLRYRPVGLIGGVTISVVAGLACLAVFVWPLARRRRPRRPAHARLSRTGSEGVSDRSATPVTMPVGVAEAPDGPC